MNRYSPSHRAFIAALLLAMVPLNAVAEITEKSLNAQLLDYARQGDADRVSSLLAKGANVNSRNRLGRTALHIFAAAGSLAID
jgi:ankyrin repeat protein